MCDSISSTFRLRYDVCVGCKVALTSAPPPRLRIGTNRLKAKSLMTGTLRTTRVPHDSDSTEYDEAMIALDEHAGCYPVKGELRVRG